uniref:Putative G3BP-like protein n=1 Tax=Noccaea caerulescens TaxID=107243 RepID=A0A1J3DJT3_NOCCA
MATEEGVPTANQVSDAFVEQYFQIIEQSPEEARKLYVDASVVTRPGPDGTMISFKSVEAINEHFISSGYESTTFEVLSIDSQNSVKDGVFIMVVGFSTGKDKIKKKFSQMFYLAHDASHKNPNSYSVFNDIFRYVAEEASTPITLPVVESVPETAKPAETEPVHEIKAKAVEKSVNAAEVKKVVAAAPSLDNGNIKHSDEKVVTAAPVDGAKMSYAAMVQSMAKNAAPFQVKAASFQVQKPKPRAAAVAPKTPDAVSKFEKRTDYHHRIIDEPGTSIFVANLPMDAVPPQLHELFKDFGPIKEHGVQVRSSRASGICFGFVAFESTASVQSVLKAARANPFRLADRKLRVKEKQVDYDGSRPSGGRNGGGSRAQNGSASADGGDEFKTVGKPSGGKSGNGNGNLTQNGSASADGEDDFKPIRSRRRGNRNERRGDNNNNQKSSEGEVKA